MFEVRTNFSIKNEKENRNSNVVLLLAYDEMVLADNKFIVMNH